MKTILAMAILGFLAQACQAARPGTESYPTDSSVNNGDPTGAVIVDLGFLQSSAPAGQIANISIDDAVQDSPAVNLVSQAVVIRRGHTRAELQFPLGYAPAGDITISATVRAGNVTDGAICYRTTEFIRPKIDTGLTQLQLKKISTACDRSRRPDPAAINPLPNLSGRTYVRTICASGGNPEENCEERITFGDDNVGMLLGGSDIEEAAKIIGVTVNRIDFEVGDAAAFPSYFVIDRGRRLVEFGTGTTFTLAN